mgnify:CR=1 FL=1
MKRKFEVPQLTIINFYNDDIIVTSIGNDDDKDPFYDTEEE